MKIKIDLQQIASVSQYYRFYGSCQEINGMYLDDSQRAFRQNRSLRAAGLSAPRSYGGYDGSVMAVFTPGGNKAINSEFLFWVGSYTKKYYSIAPRFDSIPDFGAGFCFWIDVDESTEEKLSCVNALASALEQQGWTLRDGGADENGSSVLEICYRTSFPDILQQYGEDGWAAATSGILHDILDAVSRLDTAMLQQVVNRFA